MFVNAPTIQEEIPSVGQRFFKKRKRKKELGGLHTALRTAADAEERASLDPRSRAVYVC